MMMDMKLKWPKIRTAYLRETLLALAVIGIISGFLWPSSASCQVTPAITVACPTAFCKASVACEDTNATQKETPTVGSNFQNYLNQARNDLEDWIADAIDDLVVSMLTALNRVELSLIDWWEAMWYYDLRPALQDMTAQLGGVANADQSRQMASFTDAQDQNSVQEAHQKEELADNQSLKSSPLQCTAATNIAGGGGRTVVLARAIRQARERERDSRGLNKTGAVGENGSAETINAKWDDYGRVFCNQNANGGSSGCAASGSFPDADINVSKNLFNEMTIDVRTNADRQVALEAMTENLVGPVVADAMAPSELRSAQGQEAFLMRRSYMARKDAAHVIPNLVSSWRMPGSRVGTWLGAMRNGVGIVPPGTVAANPSYREVMHAMVIDRFYNGTYGLDLVDEPENIKREKLVQSTLYLMQLRDYYELLERMALVIAVQTSTMLDQQPYSSLNDVQPVGP